LLKDFIAPKRLTDQVGYDYAPLSRKINKMLSIEYGLKALATYAMIFQFRVTTALIMHLFD
jgi:hypothetical protein